MWLHRRHGSTNDYLHILSLTFDAAKTTGFDIPVAPGGIASSTLENILLYESSPSTASENITLVRNWNDRLLTTGRYDWVDVHIRNQIETIGDKIGWIKTRWAGPMAATEVGGFCDVTCNADQISAYTESVQAADLPTRMDTLLNAGVNRVFWASLVESPDQEPQFEAEGLIRQDWTRKQAFAAYANFIQEATRP